MDLLEISLIVSSVLSFLACMSSLTPAYNVVLPFFGLWGLWSMRPRGLGLFLALLAGSLVLDIAWCGLWGHLVDVALSNSPTKYASADAFGLAMTVLNMFAKVAIGWFGYQTFQSWGGYHAAQSAASIDGAPAGAAGMGMGAGFPQEQEDDMGADGSYQQDDGMGGSGHEYQASSPSAKAPSAPVDPTVAAGGYQQHTL